MRFVNHFYQSLRGISLAKKSRKPQQIRIPGAASLALWSYAIYLIHKPLFQVFKTLLPEQGINIDHALGVSIVMAVSLLAGWALYQFVETPFMKLRARFYPDNTKREFIAPLSVEKFL